MTGNGTLTKVGTGVLTLAGTSPFSGPTEINAGTLQLDGLLQGRINIRTGGRLSGAGSTGGDITAFAGATVAPAMRAAASAP